MTQRSPSLASHSSNGAPSVGEALERVSEVGQRLVTKRIDLLVLEARSHLWAAGVVAAAGIIFLFGWAYVVEASVEAFSAAYPRPAVQAVAGLFHMAGAAVLLVSLRRKSRKEGA